MMRRKHSLITGAAVMAAASVLCKILSAVFKIPLDRFFLHEEGIAVFQSVCSVYNVFLAFCVTGIPIALSSLVASSDENKAASYHKSALISVTAICSFFAVLLFVLSDFFAVLLSGGGEPVASMAIKVCTPAIVFMGIIAAERGFFQGCGDMRPSAFSQIADSFTKATLGTLFCALLVKKGIAYGAAGAMAGVALGTVFSGMVLLLCHRKNKCGKGKLEKTYVAEILRLSLPVTLGAFGFTAVILTDAVTTQGILASGGVSQLERLKLFGYLTRANTVYNLPATIITSVTMSIVPLVSAAENAKKLGDHLFESVKLLFIVAAPCGFGLIFFAPEILNLLFSSSEHHALLSLIGVLVLIMPYVQATTAALQATGKVYKPIIANVISILIKLGLNYILISKFSIEGAPLSTAIAFMVAFVLNTLMLSENIPIRKLSMFLAKVVLCGAAACGAAKLLYSVNESVYMLFVCIMVAAVLYALLLIFSRTLIISELKETK